MKIAPFKDQTNKNRSNTNTKNNFRLEAILPSTKDHNPKHFKEENRANGSKSFMIRSKPFLIKKRTFPPIAKD